MSKILYFLLWPLFSVFAAYVLFSAVTIYDCPDSRVTNVAFTPDSATALVRRDTGETELWDVVTAKKSQTVLDYRVPVTDPQYPFISSQSPCPWNMFTSPVPTGFTSQPGESAIEPPSGLAVSPDGTLVATASTYEYILLWDLRTGHLQCAFSASSSDPLLYSVHSMAFSPDGRKLLAGGSDKWAYLWDVSTGKLIRTLAGYNDEIRAVAFSPDNTKILTGNSDGTARLWDVATGTQLTVFQDNAIQDSFYKEVVSVAFSPDGKTAAIATMRGTVRLWDTTTATVITTLDTPSSCCGGTVSFSSDGRFLLTAGWWNSDALLWETSTGKGVFRRFGELE